MIKRFLAVLLLCGCFNVQEESINNEPSFSENPVYNFKSMIDQGWEIKVRNGRLMFIRETEEGTEIFEPK